MMLQLPVSERQARPKDAGLCFRCFRPGHLARSCSAKCRICRGRHHQLNCYDDQDIYQSVKNKASDNRSGNINSIHATEVSQVTIPPTSQTKCTLLQTACVVAAGTRGNVKVSLIMVWIAVLVTLFKR